MTYKDKSGPAFPTMQYEHGGDEDGMTLRDYFAAKLLQSYVATESVCNAIEEQKIKPIDICEACYMWAEIMLEARKK